MRSRGPDWIDFDSFNKFSKPFSASVRLTMALLFAFELKEKPEFFQNAKVLSLSLVTQLSEAINLEPSNQYPQKKKPTNCSKSQEYNKTVYRNTPP